MRSIVDKVVGVIMSDQYGLKAAIQTSFPQGPAADLFHLTSQSAFEHTGTIFIYSAIKFNTMVP